MGGDEPTFPVDHLLSTSIPEGTFNPGYSRLRALQLERSAGFKSLHLKMTFNKSEKQLVFLNSETEEEVERFPLILLENLMSVLKFYCKEEYNNLLVFTMKDDPDRMDSPSHVHVFQSCKNPANEIVDAIWTASGKGEQKSGFRGRQKTRADLNKAFLKNLHLGYKVVYEAVYEHKKKPGLRFEKHLDAEVGDVFQILDMRDKYWKVRNCYKAVGYVPRLILKECPIENSFAW